MLRMLIESYTPGRELEVEESALCFLGHRVDVIGSGE